MKKKKRSSKIGDFSFFGGLVVQKKLNFEKYGFLFRLFEIIEYDRNVIFKNRYHDTQINL